MGSYEDGVQTGHATYYEDGKNSKSGYYKNGKKDGKWYWRGVYTIYEMGKKVKVKKY